jgi:hypothetical protein
MKGDKLDCPYCNYPYGEEEMEAMIWKSFKCEKCFKKIKVRPKNGYIYLTKRECRMAYYYKMLEQEKDFKYMYSVIKPSIFSAIKLYDRKAEKEFFTSGRVPWVMEARKNFIQECNVVSIPNSTIVSFFEANGGKLDIRTIKQYLKD